MDLTTLFCCFAVLVVFLLPLIGGLAHGYYLSQKYPAKQYRWGVQEGEEEDNFFFVSMWMDD